MKSEWIRSVTRLMVCDLFENMKKEEKEKTNKKVKKKIVEMSTF